MAAVHSVPSHLYALKATAIRMKGACMTKFQSSSKYYDNLHDKMCKVQNIKCMAGMSNSSPPSNGHSVTSTFVRGRYYI
eukprot:scaffold309142_cov18-Prasinocladus_malaysianus.AAC.2